MSTLELAAIVFVGFGSGFAGAYAGGASLISIPFLIFLGIPPVISVATNRVAQTALTLAIIIRYLRSDKIQWRVIPLFVVLAVTGGWIGAHIVTTIDPKYLQRAMGIIILAVVPILLFRNRLASENTASTRKTWHVWLGSFCYFLVMIFGGFCGGGAMIMVAAITTAFFGFTILQSNATNNLAWFFLCCAAVYVFLEKGLVNWPVAFDLMMGTSMGGFLGAHLGLAQGDKIVKKAFILISCISGLILIFR